MHINPVEHAAQHTAAIHAAAELAEQSHTELFAQIASALESGKSTAVIETPAWPGTYTLAELLCEYMDSADQPATAFIACVGKHAVQQAHTSQNLATTLQVAIELAARNSDTTHLEIGAIKACPHLLASADTAVRLEVMAAIAAFARMHADRHCDAAAEALQ